MLGLKLIHVSKSGYWATPWLTLLSVHMLIMFVHICNTLVDPLTAARYIAYLADRLKYVFIDKHINVLSWNKICQISRITDSIRPCLDVFSGWKARLCRGNKYSLLMHRIKIKSPAIHFMEWIKRFCGWIYNFSISLTLVVLERSLEVFMSNESESEPDPDQSAHGTLHMMTSFPLTKVSDVEVWCFLWSAPEQTVEETPMIWDETALIITSF